MEIVFLITSFFVSLGAISARPVPFHYPSDTYVTPWNQTALSPQLLLTKLESANCYQDEKTYLACVAALDNIAFTLDVKITPELKITKETANFLEQKKRLNLWLPHFKYKKINFAQIAHEKFISKIPQKYTKFITAVGYNGYLSVKEDPHTYIKPDPNFSLQSTPRLDLTNQETDKGPSSPVPTNLSPPKKNADAQKVVTLNLATNPGFSLLKLSEFTEGSCEQVESALLDVVENHSQKLILDLKNNPGGLIDEAVCIASLFIGEEPVVSLKHFSGEIENLTGTISKLYEGELHIFMDTFSASSSEILAGTLQHYKRGEIFGDISYGKGTWQDKDFSLANFGVILMKTRGYWFLPDGTSPQLKGLIPNHRSEHSSGRREQDLFLYPLPEPKL